MTADTAQDGFVRHVGIAAPLEGRNVDTDQIIPARFLKADRADGYGRFLFHDLRFDREGRETPDFVLNRQPFRQATILVAEDNFGCGSSREGAAYALRDFGVRAVIAPSFGDIFYNNCLKNGIVPIRLDDTSARLMRERLLRGPEREIAVDLDAQTVGFPGDAAYRFEVDSFRRECLMKGIDEVRLALDLLPEIEAFEIRAAAERPWI